MWVIARKLVLSAAAAWLGLLAAYAQAQGLGGAMAPAPELVLQERVRLAVQTAQGRIDVLSGPGIARAYEWGDCRLEAHMRPRSARWMGSLGIYDPAPASTEASASPQCQGIARAVVEEGQIHFPDEASARQWLGRYAAIRPTVWTSDGLVVQWAVVPQRRQLNVDVWQICVANRYPAMLPGAMDKALTLTAAAGTGLLRRACATADEAALSETRTAWQRHWESVEPPGSGHSNGMPVQ